MSFSALFGITLMCRMDLFTMSCTCLSKAFTLLIHDLGLHFPVSQAKCEELDREDDQKFKEIFKHWKKDCLKSIQKQKNKCGENDPKGVNNLSSAYRKWALDDSCALLHGL